MHDSAQALSVQTPGYVPDGTSASGLQQVIRVADLGEHDDGGIRRGAADAAHRSKPDAGDLASHQADVWLLSHGCPDRLLAIGRLRADLYFRAERHPDPVPSRCVVGDQQSERSCTWGAQTELRRALNGWTARRHCASGAVPAVQMHIRVSG